MTSTEVADVIKAIATLSFAPTLGAVVYILKQGYIQKQKLELEKIKLNNEKKRITFLKNKELQNSMTDEKKSILMAWQNIHNPAIGLTNHKEASMEDKISLFIIKTKKKVGQNVVHYDFPIYELISQTLVYSFSPKVHKYIEILAIKIHEVSLKEQEYMQLDKELQDNWKEKFESYKKKNHCESIAYTFTVYYFLSLEWQGLEKSITNLDIMGNIYLRDYYYGNEGDIKVIKEIINEIKSEEKL